MFPLVKTQFFGSQKNNLVKETHLWLPNQEKLKSHKMTHPTVK